MKTRKYPSAKLRPIAKTRKELEKEIIDLRRANAMLEARIDGMQKAMIERADQSIFERGDQRPTA